MGGSVLHIDTYIFKVDLCFRCWPVYTCMVDVPVFVVAPEIVVNQKRCQWLSDRVLAGSSLTGVTALCP